MRISPPRKNKEVLGKFVARKPDIVALVVGLGIRAARAHVYTDRDNRALDALASVLYGDELRASSRYMATVELNAADKNATWPTRRESTISRLKAEAAGSSERIIEYLTAYEDMKKHNPQAAEVYLVMAFNSKRQYNAISLATRLIEKMPPF